MKTNVRRTMISVIILILFMGCGSESNRNQRPVESKMPQTSASPENVHNTSKLPSPRKVKALAEFEGSEFYRKYKLSEERGRALKDGEYNNTYKIAALHDVVFEVETKGNEIIGYGIIFYERERLREAELDFVYDLLRLINLKGNLTLSVRDHIQTNAERNVFQIKQATPISFGKFRIYAGKVGPDQTISIDKV